jgi:Rrf2 family protein
MVQARGTTGTSRITRSTSQSSASDGVCGRGSIESRGHTFGHNADMRVSAKADYALRAMIELAVLDTDRPVKGERIAQAQEIPLKFLENILGDLRHAGLVRSQRGVDGGYWLARAADEITVAEVIRSVEGPIANVRGVGPEQVEYAGSAERLRDVWIAVRANLRAVLERVTIADLASGDLPLSVEELTSNPDAWLPH